MQFKNITLLSVATLAATTSAEGYTPGSPWETLTPTATYSCGATGYSSSFGIAIQTIGSQKAKRDAVSQIGDGQVQATSTTASETAAPSSATPASETAAATETTQVATSGV